MSQTREDFEREMGKERERVERSDLNSLAYWFPKISAAGLRVPRTIIVPAPERIMGVLDGEAPEGWDAFTVALLSAATAVGLPCFMRTGHVSGKHSWARTCHVPDLEALIPHVVALVEESAMAGVFGCPCDHLVVRAMIPTSPICVCTRYCGFPVVREFRLFVGDQGVTHIQPYWPSDAVETGAPDITGWREALAVASTLAAQERDELSRLAVVAQRAIGEGEWSADFLQDRDGEWWLTDMAVGADSYRSSEGL